MGPRSPLSAWTTGLLVAAVLTGAVVPAPGAWAARKKKGGKTDTAAPTITHTPPSGHDGVGPLVVEAVIVDESGVFDPALLVRTASGTFERIALQPVAGKENTFAAEVPSGLLAGDLEYLLEAFDENGNGPARAGDEAAPLRVARAAPPPPPPVTPPPPDPNARPAVEEGGNDALLWGAGIAVGGVILLGAAAGIGLAVVALTPSTPANVSVTITSGSPVVAGAAP